MMGLLEWELLIELYLLEDINIQISKNRKLGCAFRIKRFSRDNIELDHVYADHLGVYPI